MGEHFNRSPQAAASVFIVPISYVLNTTATVANARRKKRYRTAKSGHLYGRSGLSSARGSTSVFWKIVYRLDENCFAIIIVCENTILPLRAGSNYVTRI